MASLAMRSVFGGDQLLVQSVERIEHGNMCISAGPVLAECTEDHPVQAAFFFKIGELLLGLIVV